MILSHALRAVSKVIIPETNPVFQSANTASSTTTSVTITKPSGVVAGDLLIAVLVANQTDGWGQLSGWTRLNNIVIDPSTSIQFRIADGTEGASFIFTGPGATRRAGTVMRFTGGGNPYIGTANSSGANTTPQIAPSVSVAHDLSLGLNIFTSDAAGTTWTGVDGTNAVSFSTQCSFNIGYSNVNKGATAADTATPNTAVGYASLQLVIPPTTAPTPSLSFITSAGSSTDASSYTFSGVSLGGASSGRLLIVAVGSNGATASVSSLTIGGNATTLTQGTAGASTVAFAVLQNDNLTSADIVVNHSATRAGGCGIAVYAITNPISTVVLDSDMPAGAGAVTSAIVNDLSVTYSGFAIACLSKGNTAAVTWTNATSNANVTGVSPRTYHFASANTTASITTYDITAAWTGSTSGRIGGVSLN